MTDNNNSVNVLPLFRDFEDDETGGRHAIRGFSFQVWWTVLEAIRCHSASEDYAVVLEWQQDVAVLNSSIKPNSIRFIQLKKNESSLAWSLASLIGSDISKVEKLSSKRSGEEKTSVNKVADKEKLSILAKLYSHRKRFKDCSKSELNFVSNAPFLLKVIDGEKAQPVDQIQLGVLSGELRRHVENELRKQLKLDVIEKISLDDFWLKVTPCPIDDSYKYVTGELVELDSLGKFGTRINVPLRAVILIATYVQQRAGKRGYAKDFDALLKRAVTRRDIDDYLAAASDMQATTSDLVQEIVDRLNSEATHFGLVREMRMEKNRACMDITNRANPVWSMIRSLISIYDKNNQYKSEARVGDIFASWLSELKAQKNPMIHLYKDGYLYSLMAMIIQDAKPIQQLQLVSVNSEPKDEE